MNRNRIISCAIALAAAIAGTALATNKVENDAQAVLGAKLSLTQAISIAEQHVKGRAASAEFEKSGTRHFYDVEVVAGSKVFDIEVDGMTGKVGKVAEDVSDAEENDDEGENK